MLKSISFLTPTFVAVCASTGIFLCKKKKQH
jgi:hypothetical protein